MKKNGFTLTEFVIAATISSIIVVIVAVFFVAEQNYRTMITNDIAAIRSTRHAISHISRVLQFAEDGSITQITGDSDFNMIYRANIRGGFLTEHVRYSGADQLVWFGHGIDNTIQESFNYDDLVNRAWDIVGTNITNFTLTQDLGYPQRWIITVTGTGLSGSGGTITLTRTVRIME